MENFGILAQANGFRKVAIRCNEQRPHGDGTIEWLPIQGTVNAAFACELYLKALLKAEGFSDKNLKKVGHKLKDLFSEVPSEVKNKIVNDYSIGISKIDVISDTFYNWRYLHEDIQARMHNDNAFVYEFMEALYKISNS